jgi:hypothetical protein
MVVKAAYKWNTNGEMIADVAVLGYIGEKVLDAAYGLGRFWSTYKPSSLIRNDAHPDKGNVHYDFTSFPNYWEDSFDTVVFDPPYKLNGTPTLGKMDEDYGVDSYTSIKDKIILIKQGTMECARITKPGGTLLVKIQDQVASGRMVFLSDIVRDTLKYTAHKIAIFHFLTEPRPQPQGTRQLHARNNFSTLLVFRINGVISSSQQEE